MLLLTSLCPLVGDCTIVVILIIIFHWIKEGSLDATEDKDRDSNLNDHSSTSVDGSKEENSVARDSNDGS